MGTDGKAHVTMSTLMVAIQAIDQVREELQTVITQMVNDKEEEELAEIMLMDFNYEKALNNLKEVYLLNLPNVSNFPPLEKFSKSDNPM